MKQLSSVGMGYWKFIVNALIDDTILFENVNVGNAIDVAVFI